MEISFKERFKEFRREKATSPFLIKPLEEDISALNLSASTEVNRSVLKLEIVDLQEKDLCASRFKVLLSDVERNTTSQIL